MLTFLRNFCIYTTLDLIEIKRTIEARWTDIAFDQTSIYLLLLSINDRHIDKLIGYP